MKKYLVLSLLTVLSFTWISWGNQGHQTIAGIAEKHLNSKAKKNIHTLLGGASMKAVSTWADESRNKYTTSWHYVNVPDGLNYREFSKTVKDQSQSNIYSALMRSIQTLRDSHSSKNQQQKALKYVIHLVGDAHQPMHVSRATDKGGNQIQVRFNKKGSNLHQLWDSGLLDYQAAHDKKNKVYFKPASAQQIAAWQKDDILQWLFESYEISNKLYAEVAQNNKLGDAYYQQHIRTVEQRMEMAGVRLAGILNNIYQ